MALYYSAVLSFAAICWILSLRTSASKIPSLALPAHGVNVSAPPWQPEINWPRIVVLPDLSWDAQPIFLDFLHTRVPISLFNAKEATQLHIDIMVMKMKIQESTGDRVHETGHESSIADIPSRRATRVGFIIGGTDYGSGARPHRRPASLSKAMVLRALDILENGCFMMMQDDSQARKIAVGPIYIKTQRAVLGEIQLEIDDRWRPTARQK